jgi:hypothetical protein
MSGSISFENLHERFRKQPLKHFKGDSVASRREVDGDRIVGYRRITGEVSVLELLSRKGDAKSLG